MNKVEVKNRAWGLGQHIFVMFSELLGFQISMISISELGLGRPLESLNILGVFLELGNPLVGNGKDSLFQWLVHEFFYLLAKLSMLFQLTDICLQELVFKVIIRSLLVEHLGLKNIH